MQYGFVEGSFRDEGLNEMQISSLHQARQAITAWKLDYNSQGPHLTLGNMTPSEFAEKWYWKN